jgi:hypothetical protein
MKQMRDKVVIEEKNITIRKLEMKTIKKEKANNNNKTNKKKSNKIKSKVMEAKESTVNRIRYDVGRKIIRIYY